MSGCLYVQSRQCDARAVEVFITAPCTSPRTQPPATSGTMARGSSFSRSKGSFSGASEQTLDKVRLVVAHEWRRNYKRYILFIGICMLFERERKNIYCLLELNMLCDCVTRGCGDHSPLTTAAILEWRRRSAWGGAAAAREELKERHIYCLLEFVCCV
jgi:hypothetical protein